MRNKNFFYLGENIPFWSNALTIPVSVGVKDTAVGVEGFEFNSPSGQIGHRVVNGSLPLRRFFGTVLPRR